MIAIPKRKSAAALLLVGLLIVWVTVYSHLRAAASWLTYTVFNLTPGNHLSSSVEFFFYDTPKVLLLLTLVVFGVGIVRSYFTAERARRLLAGRREAAGNVLA